MALKHKLPAIYGSAEYVDAGGLMAYGPSYPELFRRAAPGARSPRHRHAASEQIWVALRGSGTLLLADSTTAPFSEGDVVRFAEGEVHGFENTGPGEFVYVAVTSPPINFRAAYATPWRDSASDSA